MAILFLALALLLFPRTGKSKCIKILQRPQGNMAFRVVDEREEHDEMRGVTSKTHQRQQTWSIKDE
jgi:hypothetical protein